MQEIIKKIYDYSLEEIMGSRFGRYAKTIIQDRAIPDVRDGLKPVQRRILYVMYKSRNTFDRTYKKSGETVGEVMGKYHPHGDSSIYDAMVRMSQWWKQNTITVDMQGNNGSMDGDSAAAYRYTEARLSKISNELLRDIEKNTVKWAPNYSDTLLEPTVLPARYPNLLVNGASGISAGYATNIPPHNLSEVIDATIKRIESPNCRLETILEIVKGPDFPTGGIVEGKSGIIDAFSTGRGRVIVKSKMTFEKSKKMEQIIITEIPYDVNKAVLVRRIDEIRIDKKIEGIIEVRDESDRENPVRVVIDIKLDANRELIINYLLKNTDLQISYNYNMVSIVRNRPLTLGIIPIIDAYIEHQKEIITKRTEFDLEHAKMRMHIVEGLVKALSIIDEIIKTIRASDSKIDSKNNLIKEYGFTEIQADAIVIMQLYKLSNTDVTELLEEQKKLLMIISGLEIILNDSEKLKNVIKDELRSIKKEYGRDRLTEIIDEITEIKIEATSMIPKEDCMVVVTKEGYVKRVSLRSYSKDEETLVKENDYSILIAQMNTLDTLLLFTSKGNYLYVPVHELPDLKWKELGKHISNVIKLDSEEQIINSLPVYDFEKELYITTFSKNGMVKRGLLADYKMLRYSKPINQMKLKENDEVVSVSFDNSSEVFITTKNGYGLHYDVSEIPVTGLKSSGVKAIGLKNDEVVSGIIYSPDKEYITIITDKNTGKRVKLTDFEKSSRARRGLLIVREVKTNPYYILNSYIITHRTLIGLKTKSDINLIKITEMPISDRYSTGTVISKEKILETYLMPNIITKDIVEEVIDDIPVNDISLEHIDEQIMTIDDFLDDFKID